MDLTLLQEMQASGMPPWVALLAYFGYQYLKGQKAFHADVKEHIEQTSEHIQQTDKRFDRIEDHQRRESDQNQQWEWEYYEEKSK